MVNEYLGNIDFFFLLGDLAVAVRKQGLRFGTYHSLYEWFHPLYIQDVENNFTTQDFVRVRNTDSFTILDFNFIL